MQEAEVFRAISGRGLCDDPVYIDPANGCKITRYLNNARVCDPDNVQDLKRCMDRLRCFHEMQLQVGHSFDIVKELLNYESLWQGRPSAFKDYAQTKEKVLSLQKILDGMERDFCLTHIDAVPDNFLFYREGNEERLQLTDWEYAGLQDPHVDIAMFGIYSYYDRLSGTVPVFVFFPLRFDRTGSAGRKTAVQFLFLGIHDVHLRPRR